MNEIEEYGVGKLDKMSGQGPQELKRVTRFTKWEEIKARVVADRTNTQLAVREYISGAIVLHLASGGREGLSATLE